MNTYRYDEEQIRFWVRAKNNKTKSVKQICTEASISRATLYNWLKEFPEEENSTSLSQKTTSDTGEEKATAFDAGGPAFTREYATHYRMLASALAGIDSNGAIRKKLVSALIKRFTLSVAKACKIAGIEEEAYGYKPRKPEVDDDLVCKELIRVIAEDQKRGFVECYELLHHQYPDWTRKQIKRVYRERRLYLRRSRAKKSRPTDQDGQSMSINTTNADQAQTRQRIQSIDGSWDIGVIDVDLIHTSGDTSPHWVLYIFDKNSGIPLNAKCGTGMLHEQDLISFLDIASEENGRPRKLRIPGVPPFNSQSVTKWIWDNKVALHTLSMNKPENLANINDMQATVRVQLLQNLPDSFEELVRAAEDWITSSALQFDDTALS